MTRFLVGLVAVLGFCNAAAGGDPDPKTGLPPMILWHLKSAGIGLDDASLMKAAEGHESLLVQSTAVAVLSEKGSPEVKQLFLRILSSEAERSIRQAAAFGLAKHGEEAGFSALKKFLANSSNRVEQLSVAARLAELGEDGVYKYVVDALAPASNKTEEDQPDALPLGTHDPSTLRYMAVNALGHFLQPGRVSEQVVPQPFDLLARATEDPDSTVRRSALTQLSLGTTSGYLERDVMLDLVEKVARSEPDPWVRRHAEALLAGWRFQAEEAARPSKEVDPMPRLRERLAMEKDPLLREDIALSLARLGDKDALDLLRGFLQAREEGPRQLLLAIRLAEFGDLSGYSYVVEATRAEAVDRRTSSMVALMYFIRSSRELSTELSPDPVDLLLELGRDTMPKVRREIFMYLPAAMELGVAARFCSLIWDMAEEDEDLEVRRKAGRYREHRMFTSCQQADADGPELDVEEDGSR